MTRLRSAVQRGAFALLYGPAARHYDRFTRWLFLGEWERWQAAVLPLVPTAGRTLELGSGTGALATHATSAGFAWVCVERSPAMIAIAGPRCRKSGVPLVRGDARALPFRDGAFSAVVATFPSSYILSPETHAEIARILLPGGGVAVTLTGTLLPTDARRAWRARLLRAFYGQAIDASRGTEASFAMPGIKGEVQELTTPNGRAHVYVGTRIGCDGADARSPGS